MRHFSLILIFCSLFPFTWECADAWAQSDKIPFSTSVSPERLPKTAMLETTQGPIWIEFYREEAPVTVKSFCYLAKKGYYDGLPFFNFTPRYLVQGGDPKGNGTGGPGWTLPPEQSDKIKHHKGSMGMTRKAGPVNPYRESNGGQFYITMSDAPHIDDLYTIFARVVNGMENLDKIRDGDKVLKVRLPKDYLQNYADELVEQREKKERGRP